jgi:hypothetical protein
MFSVILFITVVVVIVAGVSVMANSDDTYDG